jgi:TonB family protein
MKAAGSIALVAALLAAPFAVARQPARAPAPAPAAPAFRPWQVDWGQYYCSMIRKAEPGRPFATAFITSPGGTGTTIRLVPERGQRAPGNIDTVVLMPAGSPIHVTSNDIRYQQRDITLVRIYGLPPAFREALAGASELQLRNGERLQARVPLDGIRDALAALRQCHVEVAREWGIDTAALAALSRQPTQSENNFGLTPNDYPPQALRQATQGHVIMRLTVSAEGRVTACAIVATSGSPEIDSTACRISLQRGRFNPALDAAGGPVAIAIPFTIFFTLPDY